MQIYPGNERYTTCGDAPPRKQLTFTVSRAMSASPVLLGYKHFKPND
jgi:hypothetical protein